MATVIMRAFRVTLTSNHKIRNPFEQLLQDLPVMGNEFEGGPREAIHEATALGFGGGPGVSAALFFDVVEARRERGVRVFELRGNVWPYGLKPLL
jgi:hypothetical protein